MFITTCFLTLKNLVKPQENEEMFWINNYLGFSHVLLHTYFENQEERT